MPSASRTVRKRCVDCKKAMGGTAGLMQWCELCGGEMKAIPYRPKKRRHSVQ